MDRRWLFPTMHRIGIALMACAALTLAGCATTPPRHADNLCKVFAQYPKWYDGAHAAQQRWGTPINVLMAFINRESGYREHARPKRHWFLFIPLPRKSSAYGYAQIQDPAWHDYQKANGGWFKSRADMDDALDFVGWYTDRIHRQLGISKWDAKHLYIAYHEGIGGYRNGAWRRNSHLLHTATSVAERAGDYGAQLKHCEPALQCRHWYQFGCD
ncbi:MAG: hypothetical protein L0H70_10585 [Xanthomonadales bacterium]|nr:hypothetical protein [Xanthomonadales bacterium]